MIRRFVARLFGFDREIARLNDLLIMCGWQAQFHARLGSVDSLVSDVRRDMLCRLPVSLDLRSESRAVDDLGPGVIRVVVEYPQDGK